MGNLTKHIKRKFLFEKVVTEAELDEFRKIGDNLSLDEMSKIKYVAKEKSIFVQYGEDKLIQAFPYKNNGFARFIPEPDPILLYFNYAYYEYLRFNPLKSKILQAATGEISEDISMFLYQYFGQSSAFIIMLFTSLEAFINRCIPKNFTYVKDIQGRKTEMYNKEQLERYISFDEKTKEVLNQIFDKKKNFASAHPLPNQHITNLKEIRDSIVHIKGNDEGHTAYEKTFKRLLDFKYVETLNAVKDFLNYYHDSSSYVEECPCNIPE